MFVYLFSRSKKKPYLLSFSLFLSFSLQDYKDAFNDPIIRYSCVSVNMILTDTILSTDINNIDSSVLGASFYVFVNGTSLVCQIIFLSLISIK